MSLKTFILLPIVTVALAATSMYSFHKNVESAQSDNQEIEEVSQEQQTEEVNPTVDETETRETAIEEVPTSSEEVRVQTYTPEVVESRGSIHYTQSDVRLYPEMESICTCESGRQFHGDGTVVRGVVNPQDIGMCQINLKYHGEAADSLGYDLFTEEGNIRYSNYLYDQQGAQPWFWSKPCHGLG